MLMSFVMISFKNKPVTTILKLQDDITSSPYVEKNYPWALRADGLHMQFSFVAKFSKILAIRTIR